MKYILSIILSLIVTFTKAQQLTLSEYLVNSTIKIETTEYSANSKQKYLSFSGTGFFFVFTVGKMEIPVIVTNKHVIKNAEKGTLYFKTMKADSTPNYTNIEKMEFEKFGQKWILHPDTTVDLAILPIGTYLNAYSRYGKTLYFKAYGEDMIPNDSIRNSLLAIEDILMIGYPFGLRDIKNDIPIVRKGITATPPYLDYNLNKEFLIDMAVFPGSSGSPVMIYNPTSYTSRKGNLYMGSRLILLGINYATYTRDFEGKITAKTAFEPPSKFKTSTAIPYNIGIIIKAERLLDFKPLLVRLLLKR